MLCGLLRTSCPCKLGVNSFVAQYAQKRHRRCYLAMPWSRLRFSDALHIELSSLQIADCSLRGWCWRSKTCPTGLAWGCQVSATGNGWAHWLGAELSRWARAAAAFVRCARMLVHGSHFLVIYVADLLGLFPKHEAPILGCLHIMLAMARGTHLLAQVAAGRFIAMDRSGHLLGWKARRYLARGQARCPASCVVAIVGVGCQFTVGLRWL